MSIKGHSKVLRRWIRFLKNKDVFTKDYFPKHKRLDMNQRKLRRKFPKYVVRWYNRQPDKNGIFL